MEQNEPHANFQQVLLNSELMGLNPQGWDTHSPGSAKEQHNSKGEEEDLIQQVWGKRPNQ